MTDKKKKIEIESNISPKQLFDKYGIGNTGSGKKNIEREKKYWEKKLTKKSEPKPRTEKSHGGGVGIQTHGNKLARALNTKTPDHSKFLNEYGYLKGGVPVKNG